MRSIDRIRSAAFMIELGSQDDRSPIREMIAIGGRLHAISEKGIYGVAAADEIDPNRTNQAIPNVSQLVLSLGAGSPLVVKTLIQAERLLDAVFLPKSIDCVLG